MLPAEESSEEVGAAAPEEVAAALPSPAVVEAVTVATVVAAPSAPVGRAIAVVETVEGRAPVAPPGSSASHMETMAGRTSPARKEKQSETNNMKDERKRGDQGKLTDSNVVAALEQDARNTSVVDVVVVVKHAEAREVALLAVRSGLLGVLETLQRALGDVVLEGLGGSEAGGGGGRQEDGGELHFDVCCCWFILTGDVEET